MEDDSDQTPLFHKPLNTAVSNYDQATEQPSPAAGDAGHDIFLTGVRIVICLALYSTLWSTVFFTMVFRVNEVGTMQIGHGCSLLLKPNRFFVKTIIVEQQSLSNIVGPKLFGFNDQPPLDVVSIWSETHDASVRAYTHKEWMFLLTERSAINISYSVASSSKLLLTVTEGSDGYGEWLYDEDSAPYNTLSWNIIQGNGLIQLNISQSGRYHVAMENLNSETEEVQLNITARTFSYNTTVANYVCMAQDRCRLPLRFLKENHAVLTTPRLKQGTVFGGWNVKLAYEPRWSTYLCGIVVINGVTIWLWNKYHHMVRSSESSWALLIQYIIEGDGDDDDDV